jgi:hypothetical protein
MTFDVEWDAVLVVPDEDSFITEDYDCRSLMSIDPLKGDKLPEWFRGDALLAARWPTRTKALQALARKLRDELERPDSPWRQIAEG